MKLTNGKSCGNVHWTWVQTPFRVARNINKSVFATIHNVQRTRLCVCFCFVLQNAVYNFNLLFTDHFKANKTDWHQRMQMSSIAYRISMNLKSKNYTIAFLFSQITNRFGPIDDFFNHSGNEAEKRPRLDADK